MKLKIVLCCLLLLLASTAAFADTLIVGTPGDSELAHPTGPLPLFPGGIRVGFDSLTPFDSASSFTSHGIGFSSPDGLMVLPYSTQSAPNELYDTSALGSADLTVDLSYGVSAIGIGIADSDLVSITLQALDASHNPFGSAFTVDLAATENMTNTGNGYYVIKDSSRDIFGLRILQTTSDASFSGLAIDDVQIAPEPSTFALALAAIVMLIIARKHLTQLT